MVNHTLIFIGKNRVHSLMKTQLYPNKSYKENYDYFTMKKLCDNASLYSGNINEITIENQGVVKNFKIKFKDKNVILGRNASGKTTILNYISQCGNSLSNDSKGCIIIDDAISKLDESERKQFINMLMNLEVQIIVTASLEDEKYFSDFNIVII